MLVGYGPPGPMDHGWCQHCDLWLVPQGSWEVQGDVAPRDCQDAQARAQNLQPSHLAYMVHGLPFKTVVGDAYIWQVG